MKVMKALGWLILAVIIFIGISVYFTATNLNGLVKQAIEQVGTETLKTPVSVEAVDINLPEARAALRGLSIQNLTGYSQGSLFELGDIELDLNLEAILEKRIDLTEITIKGMRVNAEQKGTTTNIQALMNNLPAADKTSPSPDPAPQSGSSPVDDFLIKVSRFQFVDNQVTLVTEQWGEQTVKVPAITLKDMGGQQGVPPDQFATVVFRQLLDDVNRAVKNAIKDAAKDKAKEKLEEKEDELKEKYRSKLDEKLGDDAEQVDEGLKSLLSR